MPGVFDTLTSVVDAGRVVRVDDGVLRSTCPGTLAERAEELRALAAPAMEAITKGAPRWSLDFKGDARDVSKQVALMAICRELKDTGSMPYNDAAKLLCAKRAEFFSMVEARLGGEPGCLPIVKPHWSPGSACTT